MLGDTVALNDSLQIANKLTSFSSSPCMTVSINDHFMQNSASSVNYGHGTDMSFNKTEMQYSYEKAKECKIIRACFQNSLLPIWNISNVTVRGHCSYFQ